MKNIYALLVGINQYQPPVPRLSGCLQDLDRVKAYLQNMPEVALHLRELRDGEATKENMVAAFLNHLGQAKEEDAALFYFSGHGTQEEATRVFWKTDPNRRLQSLVCADSLTRHNGQLEYRLLANKELRYLIHEVTRGGAHLLTIFDCCHSGQNTRSSRFQKRQYLGGNGQEPLPARSWREFIFSNQLEESALQTKDLGDLLPEGRHVQIAACLPEESAFEEHGDGGVFTKALVEVLQRSDGRVTYYDLQSRLRNYLKNHFRQTPQIYCSPAAAGEAFRYFLEREASEGSPLSANVIRQADGSWWMDMGHLHGISPMAETAVVFRESDRSKQWSARIGTVEAGRTALVFTAEEPPPEGQYRAYIEGFLSSPVKVFLKAGPGGEAGRAALEAYLPRCGKNLLPAQEEFAADYTVHCSAAGMDITFAEDDQRPLVKRVSGSSDYAVDLICQYLRHISQWEFVRNLHNPNTWLFTEKGHPVGVEVFRLTDEGEEIPVPLVNEDLRLEYETTRSGALSGRIKFKLTNHFDRELYVSLLYLSLNFQIYGQMLRPPVVRLEPGRSVWVWDGSPMELEYESQLELYNWKESVSYFKLIAGTEYFDVGKLEQGPLPAPTEPVKRDTGRTETREEDNPDAHDWITRLITLRIANPKYEK